MAIRLLGARLDLRTGFSLATACWALATLSPALAQQSLVSAPEPSHPARPRILPDQLPDKPSKPPAFSIAVAPLGFSEPGVFYLGQRTSLVSLDFLDEDRLLFTFRVPGLIHRDTAEREAGEEEERRIRALVLKLPAGAVESEALWTVHDRAHYLWMLKDHTFLFRDQRNLEVGDASLELKPFLRFPGPLLWLEMDPTQQFLVADSREPAAPQKQPPAGDFPAPGLGMPASTEDEKAAQENSAAQPDLAVRVLRRSTGEVMLVSRTRSAVHLPLNAGGYLESLRARGNTWLINLNYLSGGSVIVGQVESACSPLFDFLSQREILVTGCTASGAGDLTAVAMDGKRLWEAQTSPSTVWPLLTKSPEGSRLARETLVLSTPVSARAPISQDEIKGQRIEILNAADGNIVLEAAASPALDAGGNVAFSPSGRRVAVLSSGQIQVFELPPAPPLPEPATHSSVH